MCMTKGPHWLALAATLGFAVSAARADMITPDSILQPPQAVSAANNTPVYANNLVQNQYLGLGLSFGNTLSAITHLNGISVWAPVMGVAEPAGRLKGGPPPIFPVGMVDYYSAWRGASLISLVTGKPMTASSLTVETVGLPGFLSLRVYGANGQPLGITPTLRTIGTASPLGSLIQVWHFTGDGINSFAEVPPVGLEESAVQSGTTWGVAAVSFTPAAGATPEPSSLILAGLGVLGLAARFGWRRNHGGVA